MTSRPVVREAQSTWKTYFVELHKKRTHIYYYGFESCIVQYLHTICLHVTDSIETGLGHSGHLLSRSSHLLVGMHDPCLMQWIWSHVIL